MGKIVRYEFVGSPLLFSCLCVLIITIPLAIIDYVERMVRIENDLADPELFIRKFRSRTIGKA
jgi:hypothetical protein